MKNARLKDLRVTECPDPGGTTWLLSFGAPEFTGAPAIEIDETLAKTILRLQSPELETKLEDYKIGDCFKSPDGITWEICGFIAGRKVFGDWVISFAPNLDAHGKVEFEVWVLRKDEFDKIFHSKI